MEPNEPPLPPARAPAASKRRPGRPPTYVFNGLDSEMSENERRLRRAVLKRRQRQNRSYRRKKLAKEALAARQNAVEHLVLPIPAEGMYTRSAAADMSLMPHSLGQNLQIPGPPQWNLAQPLASPQHFPVPAASHQYMLKPAQALQNLSQPSLMPCSDQRKSVLPRLGDFNRDRPQVPAYYRRLPDFARSLPDPSAPIVHAAASSKSLQLSSSVPLTYSHPLSPSFKQSSTESVSLPSPAISFHPTPSSSLPPPCRHGPHVPFEGIRDAPPPLLYPSDMQRPMDTNTRPSQYSDTTGQTSGPKFGLFPAGFEAADAAPAEAQIAPYNSQPPSCRSF